MDRILNLTQEGDIIKAFFFTASAAEANILRRAILHEVQTSAIDVVIFHTNTSSRHDEILALRFGQLVIDDTYPVPEPNTRIHIDFRGPGEFNTSNIEGIEFKHETPIAFLREKEAIVCDVIVRRGCGKDNVKWRPVTQFTMKEGDDGYELSMKNIGMLTAEEIFQQGLEKMGTAMQREEITLFSKLLVPDNLRLNLPSSQELLFGETSGGDSGEELPFEQEFGI